MHFFLCCEKREILPNVHILAAKVAIPLQKSKELPSTSDSDNASTQKECCQLAHRRGLASLPNLDCTCRSQESAQIRAVTHVIESKFDKDIKAHLLGYAKVFLKLASRR